MCPASWMTTEHSAARRTANIPCKLSAAESQFDRFLEPAPQGNHHPPVGPAGVYLLQSPRDSHCAAAVRTEPVVTESVVHPDDVLDRDPIHLLLGVDQIGLAVARDGYL